MRGLGLGIGGGGGLSPAIRESLPSLDLDFTQERYSMGLINKPFGDIITFTRASAATRINAAGQIETVAANVPRIDYDPVTLQRRGILIEEQRTNLYTNGQVAGGVVGVIGSGGALPTAMAIEVAAGLSVEVVGSGVEDGFSYVDLRVFGTTNTASTYQLRSSSIASGLAAGASAAISARIRRVAGSLANTTGINFVLTEASGAYPGTSTPINSGDSLKTSEVSTTRTLTIGGTLQWRIAITHPGAGSEIDVTLRIAALQMEAGGFATSYIPTSGAQATRAADVFKTNTLAPWFSSAGSVVADFIPLANAGVSRFLARFGANGLLYMHSAEGRIASYDGVNLALTGASAITGGSNRAASAYSQSGSEKVVVLNGGAPGASSYNGNFGPPATGMDLFGGSFSGIVSKLRYFPKRLANSQLQALTA